jgi:DNA-binding NarL/FixJ family response regulator
VTPYRLLLADDHDLFREGLTSLINAEPDLEVAGQAVDGLEALELARRLRPDLMVMDINMPLCDGLEATRLICAGWPEARILILSVHDEDQKLFEAIKSGAIGYVLKNTSAADFLRALRAALAGEAPLAPRLAGRLLDEFARLANQPASGKPSAAPSPLTTREREVLELIAGGAADKEIAARLALSLHTVKTHVRSILSKLHAANRRQAADLAAREGWVRRKKG